MSAVSLHYELQDEPIIQRLRALSALGGDPESIARALAFEGEQSTRRRFATETDPDGEKWEASLRKTERGGKTLTDSGQLAGSITSQAHGARAQWGTNKIYAAIHQYGGEIRAKSGYLRFPLASGEWAMVEKVTMPRRAFLGVSTEDEETFEDIVAAKLRAAGERGDA